MADYLKNHCLGVLPLPYEQVNNWYEYRHKSTVDSLRRQLEQLCMSHERLRAELSGAEIRIKELEKDNDKLLDLT